MNEQMWQGFWLQDRVWELCLSLHISTKLSKLSDNSIKNHIARNQLSKICILFNTYREMIIYKTS